MEELRKALEKTNLDENNIERYIDILSYSNQIDSLNISLMVNVIVFLYSVGEVIDSTDKVSRFIQREVNKRSGVKDRELVLKYTATMVRYINHFQACKQRAADNVQGYEQVADEGYRRVSEELYNEFD